ncbi:MAG: phosphatidate cytidylyltransferase [bacterium]
MIKKRILSSLFLITIITPLLFVNNLIFILVTLSIHLLIVHELSTARKTPLLHKILSYSLFLGCFFSLFTLQHHHSATTQFIHILILATMTLFLFELFNKKISFLNTRYFLAKQSILLSIISLSMLLLFTKNKVLFLYCIALTAITDSSAYFFGKKFGKTQLSPISPKKTIEGFILSYLTIIGIILLSTLCNLVTHKESVILCSVPLFALFGDLHESLIKRKLKIKDSSNLIPGHGGFYDRFDSYLICLPVVLLLLQ